MTPRSLALAFLPILFAGLLHAQSNSPAQDFSYTISTAQAWTDTGLDLQAGDLVQLAAGNASSVPDRHAVTSTRECDPQGVSGEGAVEGLPLPTAPAGALIARVQEGATPVLIGNGHDLHIEESGHLYIGVNVVGTPPCQGSISVKVHKAAAVGGSAAESSSGAGAAASLNSASNTTPAQSASSREASKNEQAAQNQTRGQQLKSQLSTAAQIFMQGQFGTGKSETNTAAASNATPNASGANAEAAPVLKASDLNLDPALRKGVDGLPRRVNDQFKNLGDMVNFVIVGSQKSVQAALDAASWHVADTDNKKAVIDAVLQTYEKKDYLQMPMSTLYLFDRAQDFGYEMAEPIAMVASRHHFRIWKAPFTWNGQEVWVGAGTHDTGFAKDKRNGSVTHKIDPAVDGERDNIGASLQKSNKVKSLGYYLPPNPVQEAKNATGDGYHSDGRLLVIFLQ